MQGRRTSRAPAANGPRSLDSAAVMRRYATATVSTASKRPGKGFGGRSSAASASTYNAACAMDGSTLAPLMPTNATSAPAA